MGECEYCGSWICNCESQVQDIFRKREISNEQLENDRATPGIFMSQNPLEVKATAKTLGTLRNTIEELTKALALEMAEHDRTRQQKDILLKLLGNYYDRA